MRAIGLFAVVRFLSIACGTPSLASAIVALSLGFAVQGHAASPSPSAAPSSLVSMAELKSVQQSLSSQEMLRAKFEMTRYVQLTGAERKSRGEGVFARPGHFKWAIEFPKRQTTFFNGKELVQYNPDERTATRFPVASSQVRELQEIAMAATSLEDLLEQYSLRDARRSQGIVRVILEPKRSSELERVEVSVASKQRMVESVALFFKNGNRNLIQFSNFVTVRRHADEFLFLPPKGVKVTSL